MNMLVKYEVRIFNHIGAISIKTPKNLGPRPIFKKNLRGHVWTVPGNRLVKLEGCIFNRVGAITI